MNTKDRPAFPHASVSVLCTVPAAESSVRSGLAGPASTASAQHCPGDACTAELRCASPRPSVSTGAPNTVGSQYLQSWTTGLHPRPLSFGHIWVHISSSNATLFPMSYSPPPPLPILVFLRKTKHCTSFLLRNPLQDLFRGVKVLLLHKSETSKEGPVKCPWFVPFTMMGRRSEKISVAKKQEY